MIEDVERVLLAGQRVLRSSLASVAFARSGTRVEGAAASGESLIQDNDVDCQSFEVTHIFRVYSMMNQRLKIDEDISYDEEEVEEGKRDAGKHVDGVVLGV